MMKMALIGGMHSGARHAGFGVAAIMSQAPTARLLLVAYRAILASALADESLDRAMLTHLLSVPQLGGLIEQAEVADVESIYTARESLLTHLASELAVKFAELFEVVPATTMYRADSGSIANRALRNLCLSYLLRGNEARWAGVAFQQFQNANNMTDQLAALRMLVAGKKTESKNWQIRSGRLLSTLV